jgi:hypothetical protein
MEELRSFRTCDRPRCWKSSPNFKDHSVKMRLGIWVPVLLGCVGLVACGKQEARKEITETRTVTTPPPPATPTMRPEQPAKAFTWTAPEGWVKAPSTAMRLANFKVGPPSEAECYVAVLKGAAGGVEMNINRWRGQMGLENEPLNAEAIAKLPKIEVAGREAPFVEIPGNYTSMSGKAEPGYLLLGTICDLGNETLFVKMVGPEATVQAQREHFIAFCKSLQ